MATPARRLALRILLGSQGARATVGSLLATPEAAALSPRDRALVRELVLGTQRHRGELDFALGPLLSRPPEQLDGALLEVLRLGAYQILHLRVPDRAAVSESVELARAVAPRATGLTNAVLRRLAREGPPVFPDPALDPLGWLTSQGSLPRWLAARWLARLGPQAVLARAHASLVPPPVVFRLNPRAPNAERQIADAGLMARPLTVPGAWRTESGAAIAASLAEQGVLYMQDEGSQLVGHLAAVRGLLLDACAAPGGKTTLLADLVGDAGRVIAAEASPRRRHDLAVLVARWGCANVTIVGADATRPPFSCRFDGILLDAPCSGLGTLGRNPDIKWRIQPGDLTRQARRQSRMLAALAPLVRAGGRLVYSTCSSEPEENEMVANEFLAEHPDFAAGPPPSWAQAYRDGPFERTTPERDGCDAFFAATLVRC